MLENVGQGLKHIYTNELEIIANVTDREGVDKDILFPFQIDSLKDMYIDKLFRLFYSINQNKIGLQRCPSFFCVYYSNHHRHYHNLFVRSDISGNVRLHTCSE